MSAEVVENKEKLDTSEEIVFDAIKVEYEHCVQRSEKLDSKINILLTVCAFIFVLLTSIIEKAGTFNAPMDMAQFSWIVIYWILTLVDVVTFCVLLIKLVTLLGSISFERLDICDVMENNIIELKPKATVKYIGANYILTTDDSALQAFALQTYLKKRRISVEDH